LTTTAGVATDLIASGGKVPFPYFGATGQPEHNHIRGQPLPPKSGFLSFSSQGESCKKKEKNMIRHGFLEIVLSFLGGLIIAGYTIAAPYDDFQEPNIDFNKWNTWEYVNEIRNGKLTQKTTAHGDRVRNNLNFKNPANINYIKADVTINEIKGVFGKDGVNNYSNPGARLTGYFYNDGSASEPGSCKGEVQADIRIRPYDGKLWVKWFVWKSTNDDATTGIYLAADWFAYPVSLKATHKLSIQFSPSSRTFTFKADTTTITWTSKDTIHPPNIPWKAIGTDIFFTGTAAGIYGKISATFDNVIAKNASDNTLINDTFSSPLINKNNWSNYEAVREVYDGKFWSELRSVDAGPGGSRNSLVFKDPEKIDDIKAKVTLLDFQNPDGARTRARIGGHFFNDTGNPNNGYLGDVWAEVGIGGNGTTPVADWYVARYTSRTGDTHKILKLGTIPIQIKMGNTYDLYIGWDGSTFVFKCNNSAANYTPTTKKFPPNNKRKDLATRIQPKPNDLTYEAFVSATFDDVRVNEGTILKYGYPVEPYVPGSYNGRSFFYDQNHLGEDEALPEKTAIKAIGPGEIKKYGPQSDPTKGYGELVVVVEHDLGKTYEFTNAYGYKVSTRYILSIYGHLRPSKERNGVPTGLKVGDRVSSDTILGYINDDARNGDGAEHLHMGIRLSDVATAKTKDPTGWFRGYENTTHFGEDFAAASKVIEDLK